MGNVADGDDGVLGDVGDLDSQDLAKERLVGPIEEKCCAATIVFRCSKHGAHLGHGNVSYLGEDGHSSSTVGPRVGSYMLYTQQPLYTDVVQ